MDRYGISLTKRNGEMKTLHEVLDNLRSSLGGLSETEQTAAASTIFGKEAMAGMLAIINASADDYNKLTAAVNNADGASQQMADTMLDNMNGSFTLLQSAVDGAKSHWVNACPRTFGSLQPGSPAKCRLLRTLSAT